MSIYNNISKMNTKSFSKPVVYKSMDLSNLSKRKLIKMLTEAYNKIELLEDNKKHATPNIGKEKIKPVKKGYIRNLRTGRQIKIGGATYKKYVSTEKKWIDEQKTKLEEDKAAHEKDKETFERIYKNIKQLQEDKKISPRIKQLEKALKGYTKSYEIEIIDDVDPLTQLTKTRKEIKLKLGSQLKQMKGMKYVETLKVTFEKQLDKDRTTIKTVYFNNKTYTIINNNDINQALKISTEEILNRIAQWLSEGSGWTIESIDNHYINLTKYKPIKGSSYLELPNELRNSLKGLINIKNKDNECFRWCHIRHLNLQNKDHPERITKKDKQYINQLDYTDIEFPVSQKQYNKIEKQNNININVLDMRISNHSLFMYQKKSLMIIWIYY